MACKCLDPSVWGHVDPCPAAVMVIAFARQGGPGDPWKPIPAIDGSSR